MLKISRELKTGLAAIIIIVLFVWGFNFLKNQSVYDSTRTFYIKYANIQGLTSTSLVNISGLDVGKVSNISFDPENKGILVVKISLTNNIKFSKNSIAQIYSPDLLSGKAIKIILAGDNDEYAISGDTLKGSIDLGLLGDLGNQIGPLKSKVENFVSSTDSLMLGLTELLDDENQKNLKSSLDNFKNISYKVDKILENNNNKIDSILSRANEGMVAFSQMMDSLNQADLKATVFKLQHTLDNFNQLLDSIQSGHGSLGKIVNDDKLYDNLEAASKELEELLRDFKLHPKRYVNVSVFGKKEKPYEENKSE